MGLEVSKWSPVNLNSFIKELTHNSVESTELQEEDYFVIAAAKGNEQVVKQFLKTGGHSSVDTNDRNGWTALTIAAKKGNTQMVALLVENEADVNKRGGRLYQAPLRYALMNDDGNAEVNASAVKIVKLLLEKGADPNEIAKEDDQDKRNMTLLHFAAVFDQVEIMQLLLDKGANISARSNYDDDESETQPSVTPLMFAVQNENYCYLKWAQILMQPTKIA